jgi:hypothetical protein
MARGALIALGCSIVLIGFGARDGSSQSTGTRVQVISPQSGDAKVDDLRKKIRDLEDRIRELEKQSVEEVKDDDAAEASLKALADRIGRIEAAAADGRPGRTPAPPTSAPAQAPTRPGGLNDYPVQTVRAPFTVVDENGNIVFRATLSAAGKPRAQVGATAGPHVDLHVSEDDGARVVVATGEGDDHLGAYLSTHPGKNSMVVARKGKQMARLDALPDMARVAMVNQAGFPVAVMFAGNAGHLELADAGGEIRVAAAIQTDQCGIVRTSGPGGGGLSTAPGVPASFIRGWLTPRK